MLGLHVHDALGLSGGLRGAPFHLSLVRHAAHAGCYPNVSVAQLLPKPSQLSTPLYGGMKDVCYFRGAVRCHWHSVRCAMERGHARSMGLPPRPEMEVEGA